MLLRLNLKIQLFLPKTVELNEIKYKIINGAPSRSKLME